MREIVRKSLVSQLPHLSEMRRGIQQIEGVLGVKDICISKKDVQEIVGALEGGDVSKLVLSRCQIYDEGVAAFLSSSFFSEKQPDASLKEIHLDKVFDATGDFHGVVLAKYFSGNKNINSFTVGLSYLDQRPVEFGIKQSNIEKLVITDDCRKLSSGESRDVIFFVGMASSLRDVEISSENLSSENAIGFARAFEYNKRLKRFVLDSEGVPEEAQSIIAETLLKRNPGGKTSFTTQVQEGCEGVSR